MTDYLRHGQPNGLPPRQGLYDPAFEHDACGVGCVAHLKGEKSHRIIDMALDILINLSHRGACGCDEKTGDGAGIIIQLPENFLRKKADELGIGLPAGRQEFAAGLVFLPRDAAEREKCRRMFVDAIQAQGQRFLGWRDVPVNNQVLGDIAASPSRFFRKS